MNICKLILRYWPYPSGGAEAQCRKLVKEFTKQGHSCLVITSWDFGFRPKMDWDGVIPVKRCGIMGFFKKHRTYKVRSNSELHVKKSCLNNIKTNVRHVLYNCLVWVHRLFFMLEAFFVLYNKKKTIDVIHVHEANWLVGFATWVGNTLKIKVVCKESTYPIKVGIKSKRVPLAGCWSRWSLDAHYIALHTEIRNEIIRKGVSANHVSVIPNGVDIPDAKISIMNNFDVVYVGNFTQGAETKGFDILIDAWGAVHRQFPEATLTIVGRGDSSEWQERSKKLNCFKSINFVGHKEKVEEYYQKACLHVLPSRREGMSNSLLEAQSFGLPSIVSDIPGNRAVIKNGYNGILVPVGKSNDLSDAIVDLLKNNSKRFKMGGNARLSMINQFSIYLISKQLLREYRK